MRLQPRHLAIPAGLFAGLFAGLLAMSVVPGLRATPEPPVPRMLPYAIETTSCDTAVALDGLFEHWEPTRSTEPDPAQRPLTPADVDGVDRLREISRCDRTHPLSARHTLRLHLALRLLESRAVALHDATQSREALSMLLDGWRLAQDTSHDTVVNVMSGTASQIALLQRISVISEDASWGSAFDGYMRAEQLASRFTSPTIRLEREGDILEWEAAIGQDWPTWGTSTTPAQQAAADLERVLAMPEPRRKEAAEALAASRSWWGRVTGRDLAAQGIRHFAVEAATSQTELEHARDEALEAMRAALRR